MFAMKLIAVLAALAVALSTVQNASAAEGFDHSEWEKILERFVDEEGMVDYQALSRDRAALDRYVARIEKQSPESHSDLFPDRDAALAYYINAYNALVFDGVLERGPETKSVWGTLGTGYGFFVSMKIVVGGRKTNLKKLEDDDIREGFEDPRIHAALNCASIGCPRLPRWAFEGNRLDEQLDEVMREFATDPRHVQVDRHAKKVTLNKIYDWFTGDFLDYEKRQGNGSPNILDYINRYRPEGEQIPRDFAVSYGDYDKGLNQQ